MAITQVGSATTGKTAPTGGSVTATKPTGTASGDVIFAFLAANNLGTITESSGFTLVYQTDSTVRGGVWYKVAGGSEPADYTWTNSSTASPMVLTLVSLRGVDNTTPVGASNFASVGSATEVEPYTGPTVAGNTATDGRVMYVRTCRDTTAGGANLAFSTAAGGVTELADQQQANASESVEYGHGIYWDNADFTGNGSKSGLALTCSQAETNNVAGTIVATADTSAESSGTYLANPVPTYEIFIDWDNDGGLDVGNFELGTDDWDPSASPTAATSTTRAHLGSQSLLVTWANGVAGQTVSKTMTGLISGRQYTFSAWVYVPAGDQAVRLDMAGTNGTASSTTDAWQKITVTHTATASEHTIQIEPSATPGSDQVWVDQMMVTGPGEDVSARVLGVRGDIDLQYGRDTARSLAEFQPGECSLVVDNESQDYSPDNTSSPLSGYVAPGRPMIIRSTFNDVSYTLFNGFLDDFKLVPDRNERAVEITALDVLQKLNEATISTELYHSIQTGEAVERVLDAIGWPEDRRDIDQGASTIRWWWEEQTEAFEALSNIVGTEGPPAITYVDAHGNFVFRDRHHRLLDSASTAVQGTFIGGEERISFVAAGTVFTANTAGTSITLNQPAGVQAEDLYIAVVACDTVSTVTASGWTVARTQTLDDGTDDLSLFILVKDAAVDDPTSWSASVSASSTLRFARVLAYRGTAPAAQQFISQDSNSSTGTGTTLTTPSISGGQPGNWRLGVFLVHENETNTGWNTYTPTGTERFDHEVNTIDPILAIAAADSNGTVSPTASKNMSATISGSAGVDSSVSWIGLIRPYEGEGLRYEVESFEYDIGWKDLINSVEFNIEEREPTIQQVVWETEDTFVINASDSIEIIAEADEIFYHALTPELNTDYTVQSGAVTVTLSRDSGQTTTVRITATSNSVVQGMKIRAVPVPITREIVVKVTDPSSITDHGIHSADDIDAPWLNRNDADAVAKAILGLRAERLPLVSFKISNSNGLKTTNILSRDLSDRIHVIENETFTDHDFFIERIEHNIADVGHNHSAVFGCERVPTQVSNVFTFGTAGKGFDQGRLGHIGTDTDDSVMILGTGTLDNKVLGT